MSQIIDKQTRDLINRLNKADRDILQLKASINKISNRSTSLVATGSFGAEPSSSHGALEGVSDKQHIVIDTMTEKSVIVDADLLLLADSEDGNNYKKMQVSNIVDSLSAEIEAIITHTVQRGIDDTPVDAEIIKSITSNWAYDHQNNPADIRHLTDGQITALHAIYVLTQAKVESVGFVTGSHTTNTDTQLTNEQVQDIAGPLVATGGTKTRISVVYDDANNNMDFIVDDMNFTPALVTAHSDISDAGSGIIISADERTALHAEVDPFPSGEYFIGGSTFVTSSSQTDIFTDSEYHYHQYTSANGWMASNENPKDIKLTINGVTKYLQIDSFTVFWKQVGATDDLSRVLIKRIMDDGVPDTVKDDGTDRGSAGFNSYEYTSLSNNLADANTVGFNFLIYSTAHTPASDWKILGVRVKYQYV